MLFDQRLVFVTGKGGVGKTTVAAALGILNAQMGRRTLCVEMDGSGRLGALLSSADWSYQPTPTALSDLSGMRMNTEDALREYLRRYLPVPFVGRIGPLARTFDFVADAAPGVREILSIGKICSDLRDNAWDVIIVDAEATGHAISQIAAPVALRELVKFGIIYDQTDWMIEMIRDPAVTAAVVATTPEELAVSEALELCERLSAEVGVTNTVTIANRVLPSLFNRRDGKRLTELEHEWSDPQGAATSWPPEALRRDLLPLLAATRIADERRRNGATEIQRLRNAGHQPIVVGECFDCASETGVVAHATTELAAELDLGVDDDALEALTAVSAATGTTAAKTKARETKRRRT